MSNLIETAANEAPSLTDEALLAAVKEFIHTNYAKPLSMKTLAASLQTSVYRIQNVFMREELVSVHAYIKDFRMKKAEDYLVNSSEPIGEIARRVGYESHSKFSRAFCQYSGHSPLRYRKLYTKKARY